MDEKRGSGWMTGGWVGGEEEGEWVDERRMGGWMTRRVSG